MEGSNLRQLVDEEIVLKTSKAAGIGLAAGSVWGALVSMLRDGPQVGSTVKYPELVRTGKVCGHYASNLAVLGATYVGVEQSLEKYRMKKDYINGAVAGFAAGATVMGFRGNYLVVMPGPKFLTQLYEHPCGSFVFYFFAISVAVIVHAYTINFDCMNTFALFLLVLR